MTAKTPTRYTYTKKNKNGNEIPVIGSVMNWSYSQLEFLQDDVIQAFENHNLESSHLKKGRDRISTVLRALNKAKQKSLLRQIEETPDVIRYQFTEEYVDEMPDGTKFKAFKPSEFITYDKRDDKCLAETPEKEAMLRELMVYCGERFTNADITRYTKKIFEKCGIISLRSRGGSYFIPAKYDALVVSVMKAFLEIDPKGDFSLIEIADLEYSKESIKNNFESDLQEKLKFMKEKIDKVKTDGEKLSRTVYKNLIEEIATWSKDIEMYSELTEYTLDDAKQLVKESVELVTNFMQSGS